ncbi:MAG: DUF2974 domain-containing protein [Clostridia bacterium]|nr:DUF2974 domain-containing protein [Clostridia bacterium]
MANLLDYIRWRGDQTLAERAFNDVDNLLFAELCFLDFSGIVPNTFDCPGISLKDACDAYFSGSPTSDMGVLVPDAIPILARLMADSRRFCRTTLRGYVNRIDEATEIQFSALTAQLEDGTCYVAFRGTDDTIVGWKEDFNMAFLPTVPAQQEAMEYLRNAAAAHPDCPVRVGGHSKGGNLAVYSSVFCGERTQDQLLAVYNNDGPGFMNSLLALPEHQRICSRIVTILPESSVVGMLLEHETDYQIVRSTQIGIMQHDGFSWQVGPDGFEQVPEISEGGRIMDKTLQDFVRQLTQEQRALFTDTLFDILSCTDAETLTELKEGGLKTASRILKSLKSLDKDTRHALIGTLRLLLKTGAKSALGELHPVQKLKNRKLPEAASGYLGTLPEDHD